MNKKKLFNLFILLFIMGFVLPLNTKALTFTDCKGISHDVDSSDTMIDYYYFTERDSSTTGFVVGYIFESNLHKFLYYSVDCESPVFAKYNNYNYSFYSGSNWCNKYKGISYSCDSNYSCTLGNYNASGFNPAYSLIYNPNLHTSISNNTILENASSYNEESILTKYNCNGGSVEPEPTEEEVNMFDVVSTFLIQFINILPFMIPFILVMNLVCRMLFNERS